MQNCALLKCQIIHLQVEHSIELLQYGPYLSAHITEDIRISGHARAHETVQIVRARGPVHARTRRALVDADHIRTARDGGVEGTVFIRCYRGCRTDWGRWLLLLS